MKEDSLPFLHVPLAPAARENNDRLRYTEREGHGSFGGFQHARLDRPEVGEPDGVNLLTNPHQVLAAG